jgi:hypothetical protein
MAADPDLLIELALSHAWQTVEAGGQAAWRRTQDYAFYDEAAVDAVFEMLTRTNGLRIRSADIPMQESHNTTIVGVGLHAETINKRFLGNDAHLRAAVLGPSNETMTGQKYQFMTDVIVAVYVIAPTKDMVRMVSRFVKTAIVSMSNWFLQQGMDTPPAFQTAAELEPVAVMSGRETVMKFVRRLHFDTSGVERLTPLDITPPARKFPLVHTEGTIVTAVPDPETRTFTPITPISLGKVGWRADQ